ncbi:MAG: hypothetical protein U0531_20035 [Dehalococcoidia bacterium]
MIFAHYGIPGEDAEVVIDRVHKDYLDGHVVAVLHRLARPRGAALLSTSASAAAASCSTSPTLASSS